MWQTSRRSEYFVVIPEVGDLRFRTSRRLVIDDESQSRHTVELDEVSHWLGLANHHGVLMKRALVANHLTTNQPKDPWERRTLRAFEIAETEQIKSACMEYSPCGTDWMPHDILRRLFGDWRQYYTRWKRPHVAASALLSSFFCSMLIDDALRRSHQVELSREIVQACLEVTNDSEDSVAEACSYTAFTLLVKNISVVLFAPKHPYVTTHLLSVVLDERAHRAHE